MADDRDRCRQVFDTSLRLQRAIRMRAGMDGVKPAAVINAAVALYLKKEIAFLEERDKEDEAPEGSEGRKPAKKSKDQHS